MVLSLLSIEVAAASLLIVVLTLFAWHYLHGSSVRNIPGPRSSSWIYGNMRELCLPHDYGQYEYQWQATYGPFYRIKGCFGEDRLMISDPVTLRSILGDPVLFPRSPQQQQIVRMLIGEGSLLYVNGADQKRVRNVMNPAFSVGNIRALPPMLRPIANKLTEQWKASCAEGAVFDISPSLHNSTLDAIGDAALGTSLNTLENTDSELARSYHNLVAASSSRSKTSILADGNIHYLPAAVLRLILLLPTTALRQLRRNRTLTARLAMELIEAKSEVFKHGGETEKDLLSLLVKANATTNSSKKMSAIEMRDQIPTAMIAGQESTANTIAWALYELAKDVSAQETLREEIRDTYATANDRGDEELLYGDLEGMTYLNAFLKETLRLYAALPMSEREAAKDAVLPMSQPITTLTGERITEVPIKKGQFLVMAVASYHQLQSVWGEDANVFRASRWSEGDIAKSATLGPYANLLTFLGGPRACIGWRFALIDMQIFIIEMIRKFSFLLPEGIAMRQGLAITVIPVTGEGSGKQCLPLHVSLLE